MNIKSFIYRLFCFIIPIVLFLVYAEFGLNYVPTSYAKLKHNFYQNTDSIEVIIIGNSESQLGVSPKCIRHYKAYNLSNSSQSLYYSMKLIVKNLNKLKRLRLIVLNVDPLSLFGSSHSGSERWREKFYYKYWGIQPQYGESNFTWNFKVALYDFKTIFYYTINGFHNIPTPYVNAIDSNGWERGWFDNSNERLTNSIGEEMVHVHLKGLNLDNYPVNVKYITHLRNELKKNNIELIIIELPKSNYYIKYFPKLFIDKYNIILDSLYTSDSILYYNNFNKDSSFIDKDFRDVNHLNYIGAEKFSKKLSIIIDSTLNYDK